MRNFARYNVRTRFSPDAARELVEEGIKDTLARRRPRL